MDSSLHVMLVLCSQLHPMSEVKGGSGCCRGGGIGYTRLCHHYNYTFFISQLDYKQLNILS